MSVHYSNEWGATRSIPNNVFKPAFVLKHAMRIYVNEAGVITALMPSRNKIVYNVSDTDYGEFVSLFADMDKEGRMYRETGVVTDLYGKEWVRVF